MFRIVTGSIFVIAGLVFGYFGLSLGWSFWIHAAGVLAVGVAILLNKREDEIEEINHPKK
jgi:hypothetical protein